MLSGSFRCGGASTNRSDSENGASASRRCSTAFSRNRRVSASHSSDWNSNRSGRAYIRWLLGQDKTLVAGGGHVGAFLAIAGADVRHEHPRLPGDVGAHVPRRRPRKEGLVRDAAHVRDPRLLRLLVGGNAGKTVLAHVLDAAGDPFHVLLDRVDHVGE